jgi:hypothetical protein
MEQGLSLSRAAIQSERRAVFADLSDVPADGTPAFYLTLVIWTPSAEIIAAIPLEPASRVFVIDPAFRAPDGKRLRRVNAKEVELRIVTFAAKPRILEPVGGKFAAAVGHVPPAKDAKREHLFRRKFGAEIGMEIPALGFCQKVSIISLHAIAYLDPFRFHLSTVR